MDIFGAFQKISKMATKTLLERFSTASGKPKGREGFIQHKPSSSPLFGSRRYVHRRELRKFLEKKAPERIKGVGKLTRKELITMEKEVFPKKQFGEYITLSEFKKVLRNLRKTRYRAKSAIQRQKIRTKIKFLENLLPKKNAK